MKELILLRGICGAGKSTLAKLITDNVYEADMYFEHDGEYKFDPTKLKQAHEWCRTMVKSSMLCEQEKIVVSNTFTQEWEMARYYELAKQYDYKVFSIIVENRHNGVNEHGVPEDKIQIMKDRFEISL